MGRENGWYSFTFWAHKMHAKILELRSCGSKYYSAPRPRKRLRGRWGHRGPGTPTHPQKTQDFGYGRGAALLAGLIHCQLKSISKNATNNKQPGAHAKNLRIQNLFLQMRIPTHHVRYAVHKLSCNNLGCEFTLYAALIAETAPTISCRTSAQVLPKEYLVFTI
jgi:hypothetical protein